LSQISQASQGQGRVHRSFTAKIAKNAKNIGKRHYNFGSSHHRSRDVAIGLSRWSDSVQQFRRFNVTPALHRSDWLGGHQSIPMALRLCVSGLKTPA
jgi:hypothetical protein